MPTSTRPVPAPVRRRPWPQKGVGAAELRHETPWQSLVARLRKGSRDGRPPDFGEERYKKRNTVERVFNTREHSGAVAVRYDKRGYVRLGTATAAALVSRPRT
ncbi:hypothetical protein ACFVZ3_14800 [Kitasatospora purpeofusca]|uniref:hypothetical protein n=1 Tax=Kitasatospora purpeofusca TaxID=67352 RepID=UPI0036C320A6